MAYGGEERCNPVNRNETHAKGAMVRASISLPADQYADLEHLAEEKKVSIAWVVRDAVDHYLREQWPLLSPPQK
jgi:predicted DNA-binding protein